MSALGHQQLVEAAINETAGASRHRNELFDLAITGARGGELRVFGLPDEIAGPPGYSTNQYTALGP